MNSAGIPRPTFRNDRLEQREFIRKRRGYEGQRGEREGEREREREREREKERERARGHDSGSFCVKLDGTRDRLARWGGGCSPLPLLADS